MAEQCRLRNSAIPSYLIPWKVICTGWITISKRKQWKPEREGKTFEEVDTVYDQYRYMDSIESLDNKDGGGKLPSVPVIPESGDPLEPSATEK